MAANLKSGDTVSCRCAARERGRDKFKGEPNKATFITDSVVSLELTDRTGTVVGATLVDHDVFVAARGYRWGLHEGYARARVAGKMAPLHKFVFGADIPVGYEVDHISRDTLDNRRSNLRFVTHRQNTLNSGKQSNNTSGYIGVTWCKREQKWRAYVIGEGKRVNVGYFDDLVVAAKARDRVARGLHGEFAVLNFPAEQSELPDGGVGHGL
jgi:hypothetical protein